MPDAERKPSEVAQDDPRPIETIDRAPLTGFETAASKGEAVPPAGPAVESVPSGQPHAEYAVPGRGMGNEEAAARMAAVELPPEAVARANDLLGNLFDHAAAHGIRDELDDAAAARIAAQVARLRPPAAGQVPAVPQVPGTSIAVQERLPGFVNEDVAWLVVSQTPGWLQGPIRAVGRFTLRQFECYARHEQISRQAGDPDALGNVQLIANVGGRGPSEQRELDIVANWIRSRGTLVRAGALTYPRDGRLPALPENYQPEVVLLVTVDESFLLVRERAEMMGAAEDYTYVYRWKGGIAPYLTAGGRAALQRFDGGRARVAAPFDQHQDAGRARDAFQEGPGKGPRAVEPLRQALDNNWIRRPSEQERRARRAALPTASSTVSSTISPLQRLIDAGFIRHADADGPGLLWTGADGSTFRVLALPGKRLVDGDTFRLRILRSQGNEEIGEASVGDIEARLEAAFPQPGVA